VEAPRTAGAIAQLSHALHRVLPIADFEDRLARLEQQLSEQESRTSVDTDPTKSRRQNKTCDGTDAQPGDGYTKESGDGEEQKRWVRRKREGIVNLSPGFQGADFIGWMA